MLAITLYTFYCTRRRSGPHCNKFGPTYIVAMAAMLIMADLVRHVLQDANIWPVSSINLTGAARTCACTAPHCAHCLFYLLVCLLWLQEPGSRQYRAGCHDETFRCLSSVGVVFTILCTYTGFGLLMAGSMWNADLLGKLSAMREKWRELRGTTQ